VPLQVDVFGTVTGDLNIDPAQVSFGIRAARPGHLRFFKLSNQGARIPDKGTRRSPSSSPGRRRYLLSRSRQAGIQGDRHAARMALPDGQLRGKI